MMLITPEEDLKIDRSVTFKHGTYYLKDFEGMVIDADRIIVDGNGSTLIGGSDRYPLPIGRDHVYTPGDRALIAGAHSLTSKDIRLPENAPAELEFSYAFWQSWGFDSAVVQRSQDTGFWWDLIPERERILENGWNTKVYKFRRSVGHSLKIRLCITVDESDPYRSPFYDDFRISISSGECLWRGDAAEN